MAFINPLIISPLMGNYKVRNRILWRNGEAVVKRVLSLEGLVTPRLLKMLGRERALDVRRRVAIHQANLRDIRGLGSFSDISN